MPGLLFVSIIILHLIPPLCDNYIDKEFTPVN